MKMSQNYVVVYFPDVI